jgi:hypothetical protein
MAAKLRISEQKAKYIWTFSSGNWGDARQTSETIHKTVEDFVGNAEPSDDLTKMCIKM